MLQRRLLGIVLALSSIILLDTAGYVVIERWTPLDALYMTVITIASVGFMEVHPLSQYGRIFTILLILTGSGILIYGVSVVTAFIVEGELTDILRRKKMQKRIERLSGHYIVCGADQTGRYVIEELRKTKRDFVVIEKDPDKARHFLEQEIACIEGDATHDSVLLAAGIERAKGFLTSLHTDAENLFAVITAKRLNPGLRVVSKAIEEESEQKIRMVGADGVVMPNSIGGLRMVSEMIRPSVVTFLDVMLRAKDRTVRVEEVIVADGSPAVGKSLAEAGVLGIEGVSVVALGDSGGGYVFNPQGATVLAAGTVLIVMGDVERIAGLRESVAGNA
ncbi:MAG: potassium channel protein [Thermodesulfovibrionales bacterium]